ncbi:hypothetical protein ABZ214_39200 [Streptomyces iakyrus]|uniref:hypothetical protein n=1 Tax=Streptomyces iakyrus TaxID=68219 RepID=UPI0033A85D96
MPSHLMTVCEAAQPCLAEGSILPLLLASDAPSEERGLAALLFSAQNAALLAIGLLVVVLLAYDFWTTRRDRDEAPQEPGEPGSRPPQQPFE